MNRNKTFFTLRQAQGKLAPLLAALLPKKDAAAEPVATSAAVLKKGEPVATKATSAAAPKKGEPVATKAKGKKGKKGKKKR